MKNIWLICFTSLLVGCMGGFATPGGTRPGYIAAPSVPVVVGPTSFCGKPATVPATVTTTRTVTTTY